MCNCIYLFQQKWAICFDWIFVRMCSTTLIEDIFSDVFTLTKIFFTSVTVTGHHDKHILFTLKYMYYFFSVHNCSSLQYSTCEYEKNKKVTSVSKVMSVCARVTFVWGLWTWMNTSFGLTEVWIDWLLSELLNRSSSYTNVSLSACVYSFMSCMSNSWRVQKKYLKFFGWPIIIIMSKLPDVQKPCKWLWMWNGILPIEWCLDLFSHHRHLFPDTHCFFTIIEYIFTMNLCHYHNFITSWVCQ